MKRTFVVMIALLAFGLVIGCGGQKKSETAAKTPAAKAEVKMVNDVVCGMKVDTSRVKIRRSMPWPKRKGSIRMKVMIMTAIKTI